MDVKYFSEKQIYTATFFGGPIPPGILIYKNLKRIGEARKASLSLLLTFVFTIIFFFGLFQIPEEILDKVPNIAFTTFYTLIVYIVYRNFLAEVINNEVEINEHKASNWNVAGLTILGFLINLIIILGFGMAEPMFPGEKIEYGDLKHEIFFNEGEIEVSTLVSIGEVLTDYGYFSDEARLAVKVSKTDDYYILTLPIQKQYWEYSDLLSELESMKQYLIFDLSEQVTIRLIHYEITGETITKDI